MKMECKKDILIILSLFFIAFLIRIAGVSNVSMYPDEGSYWFNINTILVNNFIPTAYVTKFSNPLLSYIGAVITLFFGGELNILRMISVIFGSLTVPMLYLFGKAMYDRKTGLLSALFLCFSAFHCLFSRIIMLEALTLFFITAFLYFFWLSQRSDYNQKNITYAIVAGAMLGLAIDAKYISLFLVPVVLIYVFWIKKFSFKALLDKRVFLVLIFAFLFFLPLLICLYTTGVGLEPFYFQAIERFQTERAASCRTSDFFTDQLLTVGGTKIIEITARGADILSTSWATLFNLSAFLLFIITFCYFLPSLINRERKGVFLMISILMLFLFLLVLSAFKQYLIYLLPFYFVMLSHLGIESFDHIRKNSDYRNIFRIFIISLMTIMLFSSFITASTSPYWDEGDYSWAKSAVEYIQSDANRGGYEGSIIIGWLTLWDIIDYSIYLSDFNISDTPIVTASSEYSGRMRDVDLEKIDRVKPHYLLVEKLQYDYYFKENVTLAKAILDNYTIVFQTKTQPYGGIVFKRKNMESPELSTPINGKNGTIYENVFKRSVPGVMKIGKTYTAQIQVKNTGDFRTNFTVTVYSDKYTIFVEKAREISLNKDSTHILKFKIVPIKEYVGVLPITADLYMKYEENEISIPKKVDSVTDYVYLIKK
jgi:4-amino-4-deoxy-L-arabinose transferase-like glycosyltransferase